MDKFENIGSLDERESKREMIELAWCGQLFLRMIDGMNQIELVNGEFYNEHGRVIPWGEMRWHAYKGRLFAKQH